MHGLPAISGIIPASIMTRFLLRRGRYFSWCLRRSVINLPYPCAYSSSFDIPLSAVSSADPFQYQFDMGMLCERKAEILPDLPCSIREREHILVYKPV